MLEKWQFYFEGRATGAFLVSFLETEEGGSQIPDQISYINLQGPRVKKWDNENGIICDCYIGENIQVSYKAFPHRTSYSMNRTKPLSRDRVELLLISQTKI